MFEETLWNGEGVGGSAPVHGPIQHPISLPTCCSRFPSRGNEAGKIARVTRSEVLAVGKRAAR